MKKTMLITLEYPPMVGGVAHYYQNLVKELPQESIVVLDNSKNQLVSRIPFVWPKWFVAIINTAKKIKSDSIEHILVGQILPLGTVALVLHFFYKTPYTVMTHAMDVTVPFGPKGSKWKRWLMQVILHHAHSVTSVSSYTKMQLESELHVSPRKIVMVYPCPHHNGLSLSDEQIQKNAADINSRYGIEDKKILLSVGRLVERKGVDYVLASLQYVVKQIPTLQYIIIGEGAYKTTLMKLAEKFGVQNNVQFLGAVSDEEVQKWYCRTDAFIMPSRELKNRDVEGFGIVYVEANSFGKPVIGGKSGGVLDAVLDGENGYLVNADDVDMIGSAINSIWNIDHMWMWAKKINQTLRDSKNNICIFFQRVVVASKLLFPFCIRPMLKPIINSVKNTEC